MTQKNSRDLFLELQSHIFRTAKKPADYAIFTDFVKAFVENHNSFLEQDARNVSSSGRFGIAPINYSGINKDIRVPFKKIYGELSMGALFGPEPLIQGYENVSLDEYVRTNTERAVFGDTRVDTAKNFIYSLADMGRGFARLYDKTLKETIEYNVGKAAKILKSPHVKTKNSIEALSLLTEGLFYLCPDAFIALGISSSNDFRSKRIGQKMIAAKNADILGGVLYEAVARFRLAETSALLTGEVSKSNSSGGTLRESKMVEATTISRTWEAITENIEDGGDILKRTLLNDQIGKQRKDFDLNKLQKERTHGHKTQLNWEIAFELMGEPKPLHAEERFFVSTQKKLLGNLKTSREKVDLALSICSYPDLLSV